MIVFDQECNFMGIGRSLLDFLGYENLRDFKNNITNINELFDLKASISNASWIQFLLDENISFQNLLLKHRNGRKIQVIASCEEIYLSTSLEENKIIYRISFSQVNTLKRQLVETEDFISLVPTSDSHLVNSWNNQKKDRMVTNIFLKSANALENESYEQKNLSESKPRAKTIQEVKKEPIKNPPKQQPKQQLKNPPKEQPKESKVNISSLVMQEYIFESALNLGLSEDEIYNLIKDFIEHSSSLEEVLQEAFVFNSAEEISNITNELKGIADNLGLVPLNEILEKIKNASQDESYEHIKEYQEIIKIIKDLLQQRQSQ